MKRVAILQSNYIPWKGYFDLIASVDEFVLYDEVQYTRRDWRNRNQIKGPNGRIWLTVPVRVAGKYHQKICETEINDAGWGQRHWQRLCQSYRRAPCFAETAAWLEPLYQHPFIPQLSALNAQFIKAICQQLGITTRITHSQGYPLAVGRTERLVGICRAAGATTYVSGPSAKAYLDDSLFKAAGIEVVWFDYQDYPAYPQLHGPFDHQVSIVDLFFHCGQNAPDYLKYVRR